MERTRPTENTPRILATTLALWGSGIALAAIEGVFAKFSPAELEALGLFIAAFAAGAYGLDRGVRAFVESARTARLVGLAIGMDLVLIVTALALAATPGPWAVNAASFPYAVSALFVAPLALVMHLAAVARLSSAPARSPGANPAAT
jgi:hypothetical protein